MVVSINRGVLFGKCLEKGVGLELWEHMMVVSIDIGSFL